MCLQNKLTVAGALGFSTSTNTMYVQNAMLQPLTVQSDRDLNFIVGHRSNFGILYYFYDAMEARGKLQDFKLPPERKLRYLRDGISGYSNRCASDKRNNHRENINIFEKIDEIMILMEFNDAAESIWKILSAILLIGEISFIINTDNEADVDDMKLSSFVAELLGLDQKKFVWSLTNYCLIRNGEAIRHKYSCEEALLARDILACTLYQRLVDWIINFINLKLSVTRTLFGSKYLISILDFFGFECFTYNKVEQLIVNTVNEQLQCYYNQRVFISEMVRYLYLF
ncbi:Similar to ninaC: Neither inactivation nor afterpotential protein C (Drosophila melanogaster) [Cotesia congregata]|uniref:Similar to ninaC: Neither inactivation nor afterpotential protein C (Drosophila melanogaster) n=1 Tax=Cotesia congregata TaxID=51543 RepID=A0A8J2H8K7_COTCN|nr:Similar to ninaC: Neither inactivation nor afterpotential protein C (Drosophila melanogaster) [Cotesia congregata]